MDKWERLKVRLYIKFDEPLVIYKRDWKERFLSPRNIALNISNLRNPFKGWTTKFVWEEGFDRGKALSHIPEKWERSVWTKKV